MNWSWCETKSYILVVKGNYVYATRNDPEYNVACNEMFAINKQTLTLTNLNGYLQTLQQGVGAGRLGDGALLIGGLINSSNENYSAISRKVNFYTDSLTRTKWSDHPRSHIAPFVIRCANNTALVLGSHIPAGGSDKWSSYSLSGTLAGPYDYASGVYYPTRDREGVLSADALQIDLAKSFRGDTKTIVFAMDGPTRENCDQNMSIFIMDQGGTMSVLYNDNIWTNKVTAADYTTATLLGYEQSSSGRGPTWDLRGTSRLGDRIFSVCAPAPYPNQKDTDDRDTTKMYSYIYTSGGTKTGATYTMENNFVGPSFASEINPWFLLGYSGYIYPSASATYASTRQTTFTIDQFGVYKTRDTLTDIWSTLHNCTNGTTTPSLYNEWTGNTTSSATSGVLPTEEGLFIAKCRSAIIAKVTGT